MVRNGVGRELTGLHGFEEAKDPWSIRDHPDQATKAVYEGGEIEEGRNCQDRVVEENGKAEANKVSELEVPRGDAFRDGVLYERTRTEEFYRVARKEAYEKGVLDTKATYKGLIKACQYVRGRALEWSKDYGVDVDIVDLGNSVAHYGMAVADATLYTSNVVETKPRTDISTFKALYGVAPVVAYKCREIQKMSDLLDWRGGMKHFARHAYATSNFAKLCEPLLSRLEKSRKVVAVCQILDEPEVEKTRQKLKTIFEKALEQHKQNHKNKQRR
jgi:hypothetical protein